MPLPQPARSWVWLVDLERACSLLVGRTLGGMLIGSQVSADEKQGGLWLLSHLFSGGLKSDPIAISMW